MDYAVFTLFSLDLSALFKGDHPTTRLCCRWLEKKISQTKSQSVLDYGCGSAILALAALSYGAAKAVGVDIDKGTAYSLLHDLYCTVVLYTRCRDPDTVYL